MNFMLSIHGSGTLAKEIAKDLRQVNATIFSTGDRCLCSFNAPKEEIVRNALDSVDVLIYHPARKSDGGIIYPCWDLHKAIVERNPKTRFYVFARYNPEIKDFMGQRDNVKYIGDTQQQVSDIWNEIVDLAKI